jgi:hypothetical protein
VFDSDGASADNALPARMSLAKAALVIDPNHTVAQKSTIAKSAALTHFALAPGRERATAALPAAGAAAAQRVVLELSDGSCLGFRFATGPSMNCDSGDAQISVQDLANGHYTLASQNGVADLGAGAARMAAAVQYSPQAALLSGHSYAVQLSGGNVGVLTLQVVRNPQQLAMKAQKVFGRGAGARAIRRLGSDSGPVETGDVAGQANRDAKVYFDLTYQTR